MDEEERKGKEKVKEEKVLEVNSATGEIVRCCTAKSLPDKDSEDKEDG